ncbi:MAG: beta-ketoacyl synthase N-terminal-like domain-containing protein [Rhodocyclaceae bacterium]
MNEVFLAGRGIACSLGLDLAAATRAVIAPPPAQRIDLGTLGDFPYRVIDEAGHDDWYARAQRIVTRVVDEAGGLAIRHAPLFVASSSVDVGAHEGHPAGFIPDCHAFAQRIARMLCWQGPVFTLATACTSSINALLSAARLLRHGTADDALVLGVELANTFTARGFAAMQLLSRSGAQPFAPTRDGLELGEAVAALRLARTPSPWRLCGGANVVNGADAAGTCAEAVIAMTQRALADSGMHASDIDLVKVQAAGSPASDAIEAGALQTAFGRDVPLCTYKHLIGHTLGASGAAEIALLTAGIEAASLPSLHVAADSALHLHVARPTQAARTVLADILGFGGGHAAVVLSRAHAS